MSKQLLTLTCLVATVALAGTILVGCGAGAGTTVQPTSAPSKAPDSTKPASAATAAPAAAAPKANVAYPKMEIKLAHAGVPGQPQTDGLERFCSLVKERSGGAITVQNFPGNQLGSDKDLMEQTKNGTIQIQLTAANLLADYPGWGPVGVFSMPYLLKGNTEQEIATNLTKVVNSPTFKELNDNASQQSGIRVMNMSWWFGERHLTTKSKSVAKPDDLKGMKIRTMDTPLGKAALVALGASTTPVDIGELYSALQMGVVDGQENPINNIYARKFYEVQKYLSLTGHMAVSHVIIVNNKFYQGLTPEVRDLLDKAMVDAGKYNDELTFKANSEGLNALKEKGMSIVTVNKAEFEEKTKDVWKSFEPSFGKGFYEKIKAAVNS